MTITLAEKLEGLDTPFGVPESLTFQGAVAFLGDLGRVQLSLEATIPPLEQERTRNSKSWYVASSHGFSDGASLQVFVWPSGTGTTVHDHSSWGAFRCVTGSVLEERYARQDDGSEPEHARLSELWLRSWSSEGGVSTVLPYAGGIHRLRNLGEETAISVHVYGPQIGEIDGRDYDPSREYVCDRRAA